MGKSVGKELRVILLNNIHLNYKCLIKFLGKKLPGWIGSIESNEGKVV